MHKNFILLFSGLPGLIRASLLPLILVALPAAILQGCDNDNNGNNQPEEPTVLSLPWVRSENSRLVDTLGRELSIRGINARIDGLFDVSFDDGRIPLEPIPDFTRQDAEAMVSYGFNVLRLPINWSGLEPFEGQFSEAYFDRLDQVIDLSRDAGLYVLLDFHQDAWSKEIGEDGAPLWAIVPPPGQLLEGPLEDLAARRISPQVLNAFQGFFENREGIQDRFLPVWERIVARYADRPEVIGFQPMNEPFVSHFDPTQQVLYDFYEKLLQPMRALDSKHSLWMEPGVIRNFGNSDHLLEKPFPDSNIVYCPHVYPHNVDASSYESWQAWLFENYGNMKAEASSWGAALVVGEWGIHPDSANAGHYIRAQQEAADRFGSGQILWLWKENSQDAWGFYDFDDATGEWVVRDNAIRLMARPYALAVPGILLEQHFDPDTKILSVSFEAQGGELAGPLLYLPDTWFDQLPAISINGSTVGYERDASSGRVLLEWSGASGTFELEVR